MAFLIGSTCNGREVRCENDHAIRKFFKSCNGCKNVNVSYDHEVKW